MTKLIISTWSWRSGIERTEIPSPKIQNGYVSKPAWKQFESAIKSLDGRKAKIEIKEA